MKIKATLVCDDPDDLFELLKETHTVDEIREMIKQLAKGKIVWDEPK